MCVGICCFCPKTNARPVTGSRISNAPDHLVIPSHSQPRSGENVREPALSERSAPKGICCFPPKQMRGPLPDRRTLTALTTLSFRAIRSRKAARMCVGICCFPPKNKCAARYRTAHLYRPNHLVIPSHSQPQSGENVRRNLLFSPQKQMRGPLPDRAPYSRSLTLCFPYPSVNYFDTILPL